MEDILIYIIMPFVAFGVPVLFYVIISYVNRKFKQMDLELEQQAEAASLTTSELKTMLQEVVSESMEAVIERVAQNEERLEVLEQLLEQPASSQAYLDEPQALPGSALLALDAKPDETGVGEAVPSRKQMRDS